MTFWKLLALLPVLGLAACETVEGFGQDVEDTGQFIESEAAEADARM